MTKKELAAKIEDLFKVYTEDEKLNEFDILHMYDTKKCCALKNNGYWDARHFELKGYNTSQNQCFKEVVHGIFLGDAFEGDQGPTMGTGY